MPAPHNAALAAWSGSELTGARASSLGCPDESDILALWDGVLEPGRQRAVEEHLSACVPCRELVSMLAPTSAPDIEDAVLAGTEVASVSVHSGVVPTNGSSAGAASTSAGTLPVAVGDVIAEKYEVERVLGRGGMGWVVRAKHLVLQKAVALKFLLPSAARRKEAVLRFVREARAAAMIDDEHVARVLDVGKLPSGEPYLVLEYLDGIDLAQHLKRNGPLGVREALGFARQVCSALSLAHARGIVHRDIKPANLFLCQRAGKEPIIKVLDFGIAKVAEAIEADLPEGDVSTGAAVMGSPRYMAPEQIQSSKTVDHRADIWALGVVLFELLSGRLPFEGDNVMSLCASIITDAPKSIRRLAPHVPRAVETLIVDCLAKDPARRTADASSLERAIGQALDDLDAPDADAERASRHDHTGAATVVSPRPLANQVVPRTNRLVWIAPLVVAVAAGAFVLRKRTEIASAASSDGVVPVASERGLPAEAPVVVATAPAAAPTPLSAASERAPDQAPPPERDVVQGRRRGPPAAKRQPSRTEAQRPTAAAPPVPATVSPAAATAKPSAAAPSSPAGPPPTTPSGEPPNDIDRAGLRDRK